MPPCAATYFAITSSSDCARATGTKSSDKTSKDILRIIYEDSWKAELTTICTQLRPNLFRDTCNWPTVGRIICEPATRRDLDCSRLRRVALSPRAQGYNSHQYRSGGTVRSIRSKKGCEEDRGARETSAAVSTTRISRRLLLTAAAGLGGTALIP